MDCPAAHQVGGWPLVAKSPELGLCLLHHPLRVGPSLASLVVSPDLAHLRVWEVGWGNVPRDLCGVLVRESRATWLAGARWGLARPWFLSLTL
jgi:hypothetical protein